MHFFSHVIRKTTVIIGSAVTLCAMANLHASLLFLVFCRSPILLVLRGSLKISYVSYTKSKKMLQRVVASFPKDAANKAKIPLDTYLVCLEIIITHHHLWPQQCVVRLISYLLHGILFIFLWLLHRSRFAVWFSNSLMKANLHTRN